MDDEPGCLKALDDRNLSSHAYNEELAIEVYNRLPGHLTLMEALAARLAKAGKE
ncbi:MAG: nucleotidyltransferase substrate binding protein [Elusimicrobiota bacterium]